MRGSRLGRRVECQSNGSLVLSQNRVFCGIFVI